MLDVQPYNVTILADTAARAEDPDEAELTDAIAQIKVIQSLRKKDGG
jgi:F0F1-type ATP synthase epsilon subunit